MREVSKKELEEILHKHALWLADREDPDGQRANLRGANLSGAILSRADLSRAILSRADLSRADLSWADLSRADLSWANLSRVNLRGAILSRANLRGADLRGADLSEADLSRANLSRVNLRGADLSRADLRGANLSEAKGLISSIDFLQEHFEKCEDGYIAYKTFGSSYPSPDTWKIEKGNVISENVDFHRQNDCGCGVNAATLNWVKGNSKGTIWKVLIRWEWLPGVVVPYNSYGKIRCERVELLETVREAKGA